ncbi:MAG: aminotransferase class III-fold pyridoxal phosphate-dependent enzyme [Saccharofermentanales bacterium]|jgi:glutamate-1-semialdehyde 2,1-aminomutase
MYTYEKSKALFDRAVKVIPAGIYGHMGPANGCFIPVSAYPFYVDRAEGPYFWDIDGNRFIDYLNAYGPNILGYNHPDVDAAAKEQMDLCNCVTLPSAKMVELAELLVDTVDSADWAMFCKNGTDVTNLAMISARAATGRKKIVKFVGGYHGVMPWMLDVGYPGVLFEDVDNIITIPFNDLDTFRKVLDAYPNEIAGVISTPYDHRAIDPSQLPLPDFWKTVRDLCTKLGIVLICDDVRCGFRLDLRGSDYYYGFKADLICFCKAIANGYSISALCGSAALKSAVSSVFTTGSYWLSAVPMAAAIKCITLLHEIDGPAILKANGEKFAHAMQTAASDCGFKLNVTGELSMPFLTLDDDDSSFLMQELTGGMVPRGVFISSHHNLFVNCALSDEDFEETYNVARASFEDIRRNHPEMYR